MVETLVGKFFKYCEARPADPGIGACGFFDGAPPLFVLGAPTISAVSWFVQVSDIEFSQCRWVNEGPMLGSGEFHHPIGGILGVRSVTRVCSVILSSETNVRITDQLSRFRHWVSEETKARRGIGDPFPQPLILCASV